MRHVSKELQIHRVLSKSVAALSIHRVTHESAAIDAKVDFVEVEVPVVVQLVQAAIVKEELSRRHANQLRVKLIADPSMVELVAAALAVLGYEPFPLAMLEVCFVARPRRAHQQEMDAAPTLPLY